MGSLSEAEYLHKACTCLGTDFLWELLMVEYVEQVFDFCLPGCVEAGLGICETDADFSEPCGLISVDDCDSSGCGIHCWLRVKFGVFGSHLRGLFFWVFDSEYQLT